LILMNNEFVARQAARWADRLQGAGGAPVSRVRAMIESAYARPAHERELTKSIEFVTKQAKLHGGGADAEFRAWTDLAHVLFNSKEFIFIR
jgi:hypothetical protein